MSKIHQPYFAVLVLPLLIILVACSSTPKFPVKSNFLGETISTTVDSEVARYFLETYLQGSRLNPDLDARIGNLYKQQKEAIPTREELKKISDRFSVDFAALFLADRLWADESNRKIQNLYNHLLEDERSIPNLLETCTSSYMLLFVPGWDYVENGHLTGADFAEPRKLVTGLGIENHLVEIPTTGSVEDNAEYLTRQEIIKICKSNFYVINISLKYIDLLWDIWRYPKKLNKRRTTICCVRHFLEKINEG